MQLQYYTVIIIFRNPVHNVALYNTIRSMGEVVTHEFRSVGHESAGHDFSTTITCHYTSHDYYDPM